MPGRDVVEAGGSASAAPTVASRRSAAPPTVDFGRRLLRLETAGLSALVPVRGVVVCAALVVVILVAGVTSMTVGAYDVGHGDVLRALPGPSVDADVRQVVVEWRLPRVLFAVLRGAALAPPGRSWAVWRPRCSCTPSRPRGRSRRSG